MFDPAVRLVSRRELTARYITCGVKPLVKHLEMIVQRALMVHVLGTVQSFVRKCPDRPTGEMLTVIPQMNHLIFKPWRRQSVEETKVSTDVCWNVVDNRTQSRRQGTCWRCSGDNWHNSDTVTLAWTVVDGNQLQEQDRRAGTTIRQVPNPPNHLPRDKATNMGTWMTHRGRGDGCEEGGGLLVLYFTSQSNITDMKDDIGQGGGEHISTWH